MLFATVDHTRESHFLTATIVLSPTSPKPKESGSAQDEPPGSGARARVPLRIAEKGLGPAGKVPTPLDIWQSVVHPDSFEAIKSVEIPQRCLSPEVRAMTTTLINQGHVHPISEEMLGHGLQPSAPPFVIPKSTEKCSFIVNCKVVIRGIRRPNPACISLTCGPSSPNLSNGLRVCGPEMSPDMHVPLI